MIVVTLLRMLFGILRLLLLPINFPPLPVLDSVFELIGFITDMAFNLVYFILPRPVVITLMTILLIVIAVRYIYAFVMWVIRKIPGGMD